MAKVSQRQIVAAVVPSAIQSNTNTVPPDFSQGSRRYFAQVTGGETASSVQKVFDGGSSTPDVLPAPMEIGDIVVTRHYDSVIDGPLVNAVRPLVGKARYDVSVFTLDADNQIIRGLTRVYPHTLLVHVKDADGDSASGNAAVFALTFSCENVTTS